MSTRLVGLALLLSLAAIAVAAWAALGSRTDPSATAEPLDAIEARLDRMEAGLRTAREPQEPTLVGLAPDLRRAADRPPASGTPSSGERAASAPGGSATPLEGPAKEQLAELVDEAVEKKAVQIRAMQDKKPSIDVFAETLALSDAQREIVEREILQAQHDIRQVLDTPTADGSNLLDELVEVFADGMAHPGENKQPGMKWFGRVMTEVVPGTSETYAQRAEASKTRLRNALQRELSEDQYALFEQWQMDPSEVEDIPGSPWKDVEARVVERAKELGAEIPDER